MATDTTTAPEKRLTGAALAAPDGTNPVVRSAEFDAARDDVGAQLEAANARIADLEQARDRDHREWTDQRESLLADTAAAIAARDKAEKKAKGKPSIEKGEVADKPRRLGTMEPRHADRADLKAAIAEADKVEIAFSDGKSEVDGLAPVTVSGDAWREHPRGLLLDGEVTIDGPNTGTSVAIAGYVLLLDGKAVAYSARSDALAVGPGQKVGLTGDIIF